MSNNIFDSAADCGADLDYNDYPTELDSSFTPVSLYYDAQKIRRMQNDVELLKVQTYGGPSIKYRYWKLEDCMPFPGSGNIIWLSELHFYEHSKTFFNGQQTDASDCVAEDIVSQQIFLESPTTTITTSTSNLGPPSWFGNLGNNGESVISGALIDNKRFTSSRFYAPSGMSITVDFGEGKKYAVSAIKQRGVRFKNQTIKSFTLYARNSASDEWEKISTFEDLVDPISCAFDEDNTLKYYGSNASYYAITKNNLYVLGGSAHVYKPTSNKDTFPSDLNPMWGCYEKKYRYYRIDDIGPHASKRFEGRSLPIGAGYSAPAGFGGGSTASPASHKIKTIELYEGGGMYCGGKQYNPGKLINEEILRIDDDGASNAFASALFDPSNVGTSSLWINDSESGIEIDFGECNKKAISAVRQITSGFEDRHIDAFTLKGRNSTSEEWETLAVFGHARGYDGEKVKLNDPFITDSVNQNTSSFYPILQSGLGNVEFPGDAAPMWYNEAEAGDAGATYPQGIEILYDSTTTRNHVKGLGSYEMWEFDISQYDRFLVQDSGATFDSANRGMWLKYHDGKYSGNDVIEFKVLIELDDFSTKFGGLHITFSLDSAWPSVTNDNDGGTWNWRGISGGGIISEPFDVWGFTPNSPAEAFLDIAVIELSVMSFDDGYNWYIYAQDYRSVF